MARQLTRASAQSADGPLAVRVFHVTKAFATSHGTEVVFSDFSLKVEEGEVMSVLGGSGCGKTTLLSLIAGLHTPDAGEVRVGGRRIGYMFQTDRLLPWRTAENNALLGIELSGGTRNDSTNKLLTAYFDKLGLSGAQSKYPSALSGGMRQRVALIRMLLYEPDILLLDEPFSALDYQSKQALEGGVLAYAAEKGRTVLFVTHDIDEAIAVGGRLVVLKGVPAAGSPTKVALNIAISFDSDVMGRDPVVVKENPAFGEYRKTVRRALAND